VKEVVPYPASFGNEVVIRIDHNAVATVGATPHANLRFAKKICIIARKQRSPEIVAALRAGNTPSGAPPYQRTPTEGGASCQRWVWYCRVVGR
jgi:hypothetical protein